MNSRKLLQWAAAVALLTASPAAAQDVLKVAIGQMDTWTNQAPVLGEKAGIFAKHGIRLENFATQGAGETLQAVISGAADIGIGNGTVGVMRAYARGAPIRIIMASHTGAGDFYWYVKSESPINSLKDSAAKNTIAYSTSGASSHNVVLAFIQELGTKATPVATGGQPSTLTAVMSGQIDMGWAAPPFGLREIEEGKIRIIANGNDAPSLRTQTVRVEIANLATLNRKDVMARFMRAYREALDWMYSDPQALKMYAEAIGTTEARARITAEQFQTKAMKQMDRISDVDAVMADGVKLKFLDKPLTKEQLAELVQIPPPAP